MRADRHPAAVATVTSLAAFIGLTVATGVATIALLVRSPAVLAQESRPPLDLATFPRTTLEITHRDAQHATHHYSFDVWIADTQERSEQGLMFVSDLPENRGMIFPLDPPRVETMWMKNTYIELDMLFIEQGGRVNKILERAEPLSLRPLSSIDKVAAVLELRGGQAAKLGLRVGDTVTWRKPAS
ncbi:MAG: DUF192 domain-containing protein [Gammaproteobacteria bacterium]|nr:DUF192 domain-containing protein [Gammaproteobacteria bacterium]